MDGQAAVRLAVLGVLRYVAGANQRGGAAYTSQPAYAWPTKLTTFATAFTLGLPQVRYYDQGTRTEKHYQVRAIGGGELIAFYQDVGLRPSGSGTASKPFSSSDPWNALALLTGTNVV